jgi:hypothetical protein
MKKLEREPKLRPGHKAKAAKKKRVTVVYVKEVNNMLQPIFGDKEFIIKGHYPTRKAAEQAIENAWLQQATVPHALKLISATIVE